MASLPGVDDDHVARGLSTTSCVAVNGFSQYPDEADLFAEYIMYESANKI